MRFSVDAHAIGCHLTGNEVYIRNLLHEFARLDEDNDLIAYISKQGVEAELPERIQTRRVSENPYKRLGVDLAQHLRRDRPLRRFGIRPSRCFNVLEQHDRPRRA